MGFFDGHVERRTAKNRFFKEVDALIDWSPIEKELKKAYKKGLKERGTKAYGPLLLFKMQLVSVWYGMSDVQTEEMANDSLSVMRFLGLSLDGYFGVMVPLISVKLCHGSTWLTDHFERCCNNTIFSC